MAPDYRMDEVAIVTSRYCIRNLLTFASEEKPATGWQINAELVNDTLFINRQGEDEKLSKRSQKKGYQRAFYHKFLGFEEEVRESITHHRILEYTIGKCPSHTIFT